MRSEYWRVLLSCGINHYLALYGFIIQVVVIHKAGSVELNRLLSVSGRNLACIETAVFRRCGMVNSICIIPLYIVPLIHGNILRFV